MDEILDQARLISRCLATVADGPINAPLLKGVAGLSEEILGVVQVR